MHTGKRNKSKIKTYKLPLRKQVLTGTAQKWEKQLLLSPKTPVRAGWPNKTPIEQQPSDSLQLLIQGLSAMEHSYDLSLPLSSQSKFLHIHWIFAYYCSHTLITLPISASLFYVGYSGSRNVPQLLKPLASLAGDLGSVLRTHLATHHWLNV